MSASSVRYEPQERPPLPAGLALGVQLALVPIGAILLIPVIVSRAAGLPAGSEWLTWALFAALVGTGLITILQSVRLGRFGAGFLLTTGTSSSFIAVNVAALRSGGPELLATLILAAGLLYLLIAFRLPRLRRLLTPTVAGTVIMLITVAVMPVVFDMIASAPEGAPAHAAPLTFFVTLAVIAAFGMRGRLKPWSLAIGFVAGCIMAYQAGIMDFLPVGEAAWFGVPTTGWPGLDLSFGPEFWSLLPAFWFVTLVAALKTLGNSVAVQRLSWRTPRAPDYRAVEGAVAADGIGCLLGSLGGTMPMTTYSSSVAVVELTGVGSRRVGVAVGCVLIGLAFLPKAAALFAAVPDPVAAAAILVLMGILFTAGMRLVVGTGIDRTQAVIVGVSFWVGSAFESGLVVPDAIQGAWRGVLENGVTMGGLTVLSLVLFLEWTRPRPRRLSVPLESAAAARIKDFLTGLTRARGWNRESRLRLRAAAEEALLTLLRHRPDPGGDPDDRRQLRFTARVEGREAELEFVAAGGSENIEDRLALLSDEFEVGEEQDISLRLLRHYAGSVRHQQYHGLDILSVHVEASR